MNTQLDPVYRRTPAGQEQALTGEIGLSEAASRLLLLVNGYTALSALAPYLGPHPIRAADELATNGLIAPSHATDETLLKLERLKTLARRGLLQAEMA